MISYYPTVPKSSNKIQVNLEMVRYAKKFGISAAARVFGTTRVTVRKWVRRFDGTSGWLRTSSIALRVSQTDQTSTAKRYVIKRISTYCVRTAADAEKHHLSCSGRTTPVHQPT